MADLESLKQAVALSPDNAPLLVLLGKAYLENLAPDEARQQFERALGLEPSNLDASLGVIESLSFVGRTSEAIVRCEALLGERADSAPAKILLARLHLKEGDGPASRRLYDEALALDPALADPSLLRRIEEAGGKSASSRDRDPEAGAAPASANDWQAGAVFDPDYDENDADEDSTEELKLEFLQNTDVDFEHVGGMNEVKKDIRMKILLPLQKKELFKAYGKKAGGGVLMYGPPGCGKTLISKATAGEIDANFFAIGLHQVLEMWIGRSEQKLHEIFELARQTRPAVLFFDEIDALAADRRDMRGSAARTLINQFLAELDGTNGDNEEVLILGATNAPWHLDAAFLRPGRFDRLIFVPPPDEEARASIIRILAKGKPVSDLDAEALAKKTEGFSGADLKAVFDLAVEDALEASLAAGDEIIPIGTKQLLKARKRVKPSTSKWFESAKNYALYANQSGFYDDVLDHLGIKRP